MSDLQILHGRQRRETTYSFLTLRTSSLGSKFFTNRYPSSCRRSLISAIGVSLAVGRSHRMYWRFIFPWLEPTMGSSPWVCVDVAVTPILSFSDVQDAEATLDKLFARHRVSVSWTPVATLHDTQQPEQRNETTARSALDSKLQRSLPFPRPSRLVKRPTNATTNTPSRHDALRKGPSFAVGEFLHHLELPRPIRHASFISPP
jgi:hypothetical protein